MASISLIVISAITIFACSNEEETATKEESKFIKVDDMAFVGELHNAVMSGVLREDSIRHFINLSEGRENAIENLRKLTEEQLKKFSGESHELKKYKHIFEPEKVCKSLFQATRTRGRHDLVLKEIENLSKKETLDLEDFPNIYDIVDAFNEEGIISDKGYRFYIDILTLTEDGLNERINYDEMSAQIQHLKRAFNDGNFSIESIDGGALASTLSVAESSLEWWEENHDSIPIQNLPPWVAADITGGAIGLVFYCFENWNERVVLKKLGLKVADGAVSFSIGKKFF